jgi:hypothetical protein
MCNGITSSDDKLGITSSDDKLGIKSPDGKLGLTSSDDKLDDTILFNLFIDTGVVALCAVGSAATCAVCCHMSCQSDVVT